MAFCMVVAFWTCSCSTQPVDLGAHHICGLHLWTMFRLLKNPLLRTQFGYTKPSSRVPFYLEFETCSDDHSIVLQSDQVIPYHDHHTPQKSRSYSIKLQATSRTGISNTFFSFMLWTHQPDILHMHIWLCRTVFFFFLAHASYVICYLKRVWKSAVLLFSRCLPDPRLPRQVLVGVQMCETRDLWIITIGHLRGILGYRWIYPYMMVDDELQSFLNLPSDLLGIIMHELGIQFLNQPSPLPLKMIPLKTWENPM